MLKRFLSWILRILSSVGLFILMTGLNRAAAAASPTSAAPAERIFGVTVDDSWYGEIEPDAITDALRSMPVKPTVRIVMADDISMDEYRELFAAVSAVAAVMAEPVDSYYMRGYPDAESYVERFRAAYEILAPYVDIWEIGNEINGVAWIRQDPELIIAKTLAANDYIKSRGGKTALTLYYADPADQDLFAWLARYLPARLRGNVDYAFISYYEDDNNGCLPDWEQVFRSLEREFPDAAIGIGECGNTAQDATVESKIAMAKAYYGMERFSDRFAGGFFWWSWVQDCVPHQENPVYTAINAFIEQSLVSETTEKQQERK